MSAAIMAQVLPGYEDETGFHSGNASVFDENYFKCR
jgi:hypothetical protein